jgi:hypothetical protein
MVPRSDGGQGLGGALNELSIVLGSPVGTASPAADWASIQGRSIDHLTARRIPSMRGLPRWKVLQFLVGAQQAGQLAGLFDLRPLPFGRAEGIEFQRQVQFEGYIIGLNGFAATL